MATTFLPEYPVHVEIINGKVKSVSNPLDGHRMWPYRHFDLPKSLGNGWHNAEGKYNLSYARKLYRAGKLIFRG